MEEFEYKTLIEKRKMAIDELQKYYISMMEYEYKSEKKVTFTIQKRMYTLVKLILKIDRLLNHRSIRIVNNKSYNENTGIIYACTKSGIHDIETVLEATNNPAWAVVNEASMSQIIEFLIRTNFLTINNNSNKVESRIIRNQEKRLLSSNNNIILFPEKNKLENQVGELNDEVSELIVETGATIVPIAIEEHQKDNKTTYLVNIGKNLSFGKIDSSFIPDITEIIRLDLNNLKEEISAKSISKKYVKSKKQSVI